MSNLVPTFYSSFFLPFLHRGSDCFGSLRTPKLGLLSEETLKSLLKFGALKFVNFPFGAMVSELS